MHSDLEQEKRGEVMARFKNRSLNILVATDIVSRGIDIEDIDLVINYDVPHDGEDYVHRIGRTARAETTGVAVTLVNDTDMPKMHRIERLIENEVYKAPLPEFLGTGPEWKIRSTTPRDHFRKKGGVGQKRKYGDKPASKASTETTGPSGESGDGAKNPNRKKFRNRKNENSGQAPEQSK
jgi:superfamily II DNA/RNA helicase